jgi:hypothetical protein
MHVFVNEVKKISAASTTRVQDFFNVVSYHLLSLASRKKAL